MLGAPSFPQLHRGKGGRVQASISTENSQPETGLALTAHEDRSLPRESRCGFSTPRVTLKVMRTVYIGMGGNMASWAGAPEATLAAAAQRLESLGRMTRRSSHYSTTPVGFAAQPRFVNAVVELETELEPRGLLEGLQGIELEFGRDRSAGIANGPRTLDLDILLFGELKISESGLEIPHPRLAERAFVLVPLNEIAAGVVVPGAAKTVGQLLTRLIEATKAISDAVVQVRSKVSEDKEIGGWPSYREK
jgi:2-amino-4-hydroxy-6-hydroxymethyldihydropteridine diphosphokinase